ncbi:asparagine synthase (glutamine-hydrolyzing) [Campylobacter hyointestinalis subsp. hyointestinalis]|uniref:asparagine synthase (glutamine-hydrolyzing) n=1 Tax=Campylobacter hyointestinalis subsp. hyointestinalis TaxID=91352 RepID=A0A9W5AIK0_CAMHY|nr:asparagine synthase (glutamine-hydrolyzing) [Campylobacter hyointestinalis]CUU68783.1 asparagine synthase (glutamine-hydrolyzing) [Campylobacter hyointestinalis subsp. hyointestinalis]CUU85643.1 asparagine synthase (glutamine-hydrolyzing) [Campylobacter hyointestinalis subsp. hyointestinalis]CUU86141.1 asparagine synthase (glutamine-hydrolyzing) [Campylobacter hyointestinalis subsp. hyointestinalis]
MCGITGIISKKQIDKNIIKPMTDVIVHRGPDGEGFYFGDNFAFGHRRLAIVDLSQAGHQPMGYLDRYVITYNGEIYNFIDLKDILIKAGYSFKNHTDTEVVMASYDYWGVDCLNKFNGMWAFVIYDKVKDEYFISRDRFGVKPLYYYIDDEKFIFASEIKSILQYPDINIKLNNKFLQDYLNDGCKEFIKTTAFTNVFRFDVASYFKGSIDELLSNFKQNRFWKLKPNFAYEKFDKSKASKYAEEYYNLLKDAVRIRLNADVKVGSALSGGLDSSSIVYLINQILKEENKQELQETFSSVYHSEGTQDCDESKFIKSVADHLGVNSNTIEPKVSDIPNEHQKMIYHLENPPENTLMSSWYTFKLIASTEVKVTLDGQGADEQLAGYTPYVMTYLSSLGMLELLKESLFCCKRIKNKKSIIRGFLIGLFKNLFGQKIIKFLINKYMHKTICFNLNSSIYKDFESSLVTLLHYADHTSMAHSIESRMPFMDYRLVEFLASIPSCYKMHMGWTKYIARLAFDKRLPDDVVWRVDKMGWPIPEKHWFEVELKDWMKSIIMASKYIDKIYNSKIKLTLSKQLRMLNISVFEKCFFK